MTLQNDSFKVGSASVGTTTTGADLSPLIPAQEWAKVISERIGLKVLTPKENYPMFLIDSEGMGIRGEAFDFITTSPPAVISKVITGNFQRIHRVSFWSPPEILSTAHIQ